jgi:signal transduction histidine kinase
VFHHYPDLSRISTFDTAGNRLASSRPDGATFVGDQASFQDAVRRGQQTWEIAPAAAADRVSLLIRTPIRDEDRRVVGVVSSVVDLDALSALIDRVAAGGGRRAFVADAAGRIVAHPDSQVVQEQRDLASLGLSGAGRLRGTGSTVFMDGRESRVAGFAPVPSLGWTVVVDRSEADVIAPAESSFRLAQTALAASVGLAVAGAALLARTLTRPVRQLVAAARAIGAGDLTAPLPSPSGRDPEVATLVAAFRDMRDNIATRTAERVALLVQEQESRARAEAAVRSRDEFLSVAAHELKTPITSLLASTQLVLRRAERDGALDPRRAEQTLRTAVTQSTKLARLVAQLLDVSRIESGKLALEPRGVDPPDLGAAAAPAARARTTSHEIRVREARSATAAPIVVPADPLRLEQVLTNLLDNAIKYSPEGGPVEIALERDTASTVRLAVRDHGIGIPADRRAHIFDRFYQAHGEGYLSGMGLGLHISRQIVELHGGTIAAEFPEDEGTRFVVRLPSSASAAPILPESQVPDTSSSTASLPVGSGPAPAATTNGRHDQVGAGSGAGRVP